MWPKRMQPHRSDRAALLHCERRPSVRVHKDIVEKHIVRVGTSEAILGLHMLLNVMSSIRHFAQAGDLAVWPVCSRRGVLQRER
jgi:hypothetical protein